MSCCFTVVSTSEVAVVEKCGKFDRFAEAGLACFFMYPFEYTAGKISLRVQELNCNLETKTKDNVFVTVASSVQFQIIKDKVYQAFYLMSEPRQQMRAYVLDIIRASICNMTLDEAFESKEDISQQLKGHLSEVMAGYGISILQALVTDLSPDSRVRDAMNEINASKRFKESAVQRAEGEKILKVKKAEAEAESMYLSGVGVARQRKAIMMGLKESIVDFSSSVDGATAKDVMDLLVLNQYFDTLQDLGGGGGRCVFLPSDQNQMRNAIMEAQAAKY